MKPSMFIISQKGENPGTILLYSTFSTSIVELEENVYNAIFCNSDYSRYTDEVAALFEMGFLIDDNKNEAAYLKSLRRVTLESNTSSPTYYIICPTTGCNARCYYCFEKGVVQKRMNKAYGRFLQLL